MTHSITSAACGRSTAEREAEAAPPEFVYRKPQNIPRAIEHAFGQ
jgi:hypothetical protein